MTYTAVAARLAGGDVIEIAPAGKPGCYEIWVDYTYQEHPSSS